MHKQIYEKLKEIAKNGAVTYYNDIAPMAGLNMNLPHDRYEIGILLDEINKYERTAGRPMISAVVVQKGNLKPGKGFFKLARTLGLLIGSDEDKFYIQELHKVHDYWSHN